MKKILKNSVAVMLMLLLACTVAFIASPEASAAEPGTLVSNAINLYAGEWYTKYWTSQNDNLNCYNKIVVPERGYITFTAEKPFDDEGEICSYYLYLYTPDGQLVWTCNTDAQSDSFTEYYTYKIGLDAGTYYMNLDPSFYVYSDSAPIDARYKYDFTKSDYWEVESNNDMSKATVLTLGKTYNGVFADESFQSSYDDYFTFKLTKGTEYNITLYNFKTLDAGTLVEEFFDPDSEQISLYNDREKDVGNSRVWTIKAMKTGWYYFALTNDANDAGTEYQIKIAETPKIPASKLKAKLSKNTFTYNGKVQTPGVTVTDNNGNTLKMNTDYTVKYESGRKLPGTYTVTITFKGAYTGTKKLNYTIAPKTTAKITLVQSTKAIKLTWDKVTGADGYRVFQYVSGKWKSIKTTTATSYKVQKLKAGTTYKFRIKAYVKDEGTIWGEATSTIVTATRTATPKITKLTAAKAKAAVVWSNVDGENGYELYASTKKDGGFKRVAVTKANAAKATVSKLSSGKTYYFKVRAYKTVDGAKMYSAWSAVKSIKIK